MDEVAIDQIKPSPYQLRLNFKTEDLKEEIRKDGLLTPLIVRRKNGYYELIDGQRRLETLKELEWKKVPVEIQEVDDQKARLMVYKLNSIRESYSTEEKARYFEKLHKEGMKAYAIGQEFHINDSTIRAYLNIFKFPQDIQRSIFDGRPSIGQIQDMETFVNEDIDFAIKFARQIITQDLKELESRKLLRPYREEREKMRVEEAKKAIGTYVPSETTLETPEELERTAEVLRKEAKKKREEILTPEEKAEEKRTKEEKKGKSEESRKRREEERRRQIEEEARKRARELEEAERRRIEEETKAKAKEELMKNREFLEQATKALQVAKLREEYARELKQTRLAPMVNILNEFTGDEWLKFTKSWYIFDALESDLGEERTVTIDVVEHPATFSPTMISDYVRFFTKKDGVVLDPFVGIGSTLVACMRAGRKGIGIDINEKYVEIARKRVAEDPRQQVIYGNAWEIEKSDLPKIDYCITSPPYFRMLEKIDVTQKKRMQAGLETDYGDVPIPAKDVDDYVSKLVDLFNKIADITRDGGYLTVILQNFRDKARMSPLAWKFAMALETTGKWVFKGERIWCQDHKSLHPFGYPADWVPNIHHHYCLIFRKVGEK
jgi:ParB/RepB/Spo0J family partition protein